MFGDGEKRTQNPGTSATSAWIVQSAMVGGASEMLKAQNADKYTPHQKYRQTH